MFQVLLDPHNLAKVLDGMAIHACHTLHPVRVTIARHPKLGICTLVQTSTDLDTVVISERCILSGASLDDERRAASPDQERPEARATPLHVAGR